MGEIRDDIKKQMTKSLKEIKGMKSKKNKREYLETIRKIVMEFINSEEHKRLKSNVSTQAIKNFPEKINRSKILTGP